MLTRDCISDPLRPRAPEHRPAPSHSQDPPGVRQGPEEYSSYLRPPQDRPRPDETSRIPDEIRARLRQKDAIREAEQLLSLVSSLYPPELCAMREQRSGPTPKLRTTIPVISRTAGLPVRLALARLTALEAAGLLEVGEDPLITGRRVVWLTAEGEDLAAELAGISPAGWSGSSLWEGSP